MGGLWRAGLARRQAGIQLPKKNGYLWGGQWPVAPFPVPSIQLGTGNWNCWHSLLTLRRFMRVSCALVRPKCGKLHWAGLLARTDWPLALAARTALRALAACCRSLSLAKDYP